VRPAAAPCVRSSLRWPHRLLEPIPCLHAALPPPPAGYNSTSGGTWFDYTRAHAHTGTHARGYRSSRRACAESPHTHPRIQARTQAHARARTHARTHAHAHTIQTLLHAEISLSLSLIAGGPQAEGVLRRLAAAAPAGGPPLNGRVFAAAVDCAEAAAAAGRPPSRVECDRCRAPLPPVSGRVGPPAGHADAPRPPSSRKLLHAHTPSLARFLSRESPQSRYGHLEAASLAPAHTRTRLHRERRW
jgi:hypothetical protein